MVFPVLVWGGVAIAGAAAGGFLFNEAGDAADSATRLVKWGTVAGGLYVSYRALKASGALK